MDVLSILRIWDKSVETVVALEAAEETGKRRTPCTCTARSSASHCLAGTMTSTPQTRNRSLCRCCTPAAGSPAAMLEVAVVMATPPPHQ